jgi:hypothetical protein
VQRRDLIFPLYYIECPVLERPERRTGNNLAQQVAGRERRDWRDLRFTSLADGPARQRLAGIATEIRAALDLVQTVVVPEVSGPPVKADVTPDHAVIGETQDMESDLAIGRWAFPGAPEAGSRSYVDPKNFLPESEIRRVVAASSMIQAREHVREALLLFETRVQHTWIVTTSLQVFCVLDDTRKRPTGRLVQWTRPLGEIDMVRVRPHRPGAGLIDIGPKRNWLYSKRLHPVAERLEEDIRTMVARARQALPR